MWLHAIAQNSNSKKEKQKIYLHGLFYINNYINKSNNNYCNKISITGLHIPIYVNFYIFFLPVFSTQ